MCTSRSMDTAAAVRPISLCSLPLLHIIYWAGFYYIALWAPAPLPGMRDVTCCSSGSMRRVRQSCTPGRTVRDSTVSGPSRTPWFLRWVQRHRSNAEWPVSGTGTAGQSKCGFRRACSCPEHDSPGGTKAAPCVLRQPARCCLPGRLDAGSRETIPSPSTDVCAP